MTLTWPRKLCLIITEITYVCSRVIGRPFDDPKGRWRVVGEVNGPVKIEMEAARSSISELKEELLKLGIRARIN